MALSTAKLTELPLPPRFFSTLPFSCRKTNPFSHLLFKSFSSSLRSTPSTKVTKIPSQKPHNSHSASWLNKWPSPPTPASPSPPLKQGSKKPDPNSDTTHVGTTAIERIVLRLRNLGLGSDDEEDDEDGDINSSLNLDFNDSERLLDGEEKLGDLLKRDWVRPDTILLENEDDEDDALLPWERGVKEEEEVEEEKGRVKRRAVRTPTLAELTIEDEELRRLRRTGITLRERINVPKAGITGEVLEKIHDKWRKCELVRLKFHEVLAHDMKTAHEIVERRTRGLVIWRSGSVMVVFRGINYEGPISKPQRMTGEGDAVFVPNVSSPDNSVVRSSNDGSSVSEKSYPVLSGRAESMTEEEAEYNNLLDGLGPRFEDWWGTGVLPVDADLLPQSIPGYKTPFRLLPTGMRSRLTNAEMTNLRKIAKSLPCHFALGRNRHHQGLAKAIIKLWEKSLVVKIAVKRGIQNTNNKIMAEEIKTLTGGVLLLRNKYYIVIYRGKDFLSPTVAAALAERQERTKQIQDVEEKVRSGPAEAVSVVEDEGALAGTLAEFYEAQARWGRDMSAEEHEKMKEEASRASTMKVIRRLEHKIAISQAKKLKAESLLSKIIASWVPAGPSDDQETITDEERVMFRRVGLRMKAYLPLGIRGVFDGVIENMHLHWKHRELVKLISKEKELAFVEETARLLEYESSGILVAIERVPKGYALVYYRGKNYRRPITLRPRNLLTKAKALKRRVALQRYEALSQHISELEKTIEQTKQQIGDSKHLENSELWNSEDDGQFNCASESNQSEDEASWMGSGGNEDEDNWEDYGDSELPSVEEFDEIPSCKMG
ncbi:unnamed protein product [Fraxinus pennsylvanica]|uniref:CRM domain-containing protein n=1 Tax=Fraxinus pennsylvanica TaxID=56036 RepID=A0AAD2AEE2_9LAMI|nr:unnamed protein product [Fraxinus pennsylvanica]